MGREDLEGRALTNETGLVGLLWDRGLAWTACLPGVPGAAAPPPPASGGAALLQPDLHRRPPHIAYKKRRGVLLADKSETVKHSECNQAKLL